MSGRYDEEIIRYFIRKEKQERYRWMLARPKHRKPATAALNGIWDIEPRCLEELPKRVPDPEALCSLLQSRGAGKQAYVLSYIDEIDGQVLPLLDALKACVGYSNGTIIYCFAGQIGYFEGDSIGFYLLHKAPQS